jgi:hypothetical protein
MRECSLHKKQLQMSEYAIEKQIKDNYTDRISLAECKKILDVIEYGYSDEEVLIVRDFLYSLAVVDYNYHERSAKRETQIIELKPKGNDDTKESHSLLPSEYRRAS